MADVLTIAGSTITLANYNATLDRVVPVVKGGLPELHFSKIVGALAALPDPWSAKAVTLSVSGTSIFAGDVVGHVDRYFDGTGWVREYRCLGLRNRADYIPVTDAITLTDTAVFNVPSDDPNYTGSRAGQSVGQIVAAVLTMAVNAVPLSTAGIGAYTTLSPPTLPTLTVNDLAALTVIPPWRVSIAGERILQVLEDFVTTCHPNHWLHIQPDGTIRFLDQRLAHNNTLTLGGDARLDMPTITRDYSDCYSQVEIRGNVIASPVILQTLPWPGSANADGGLQEDFGWGGLTSAAAKAAWHPSDFRFPENVGAGNDTGTCLCTDASHVTVTSSIGTASWAANFWGQSGTEAQGTVFLYADVITGVTQNTSARVIANTPLTPGGSSILTLDRPLTSLAYTSYKLWGMDFGPSVVYRKYKITNPNIGSALLNFFPYPVAVHLAAVSNAAWLTSSILGFQQNSETGSGPPYGLASIGITVDPVNGVIFTDKPTAISTNLSGTTFIPPYNVIAFLAVATGNLAVFAPVSGGLPSYSGTSYSVEGIKRTKVITVRDWKDYSNTSSMTTYANEFLSAVQDVVVEGTVPYHGLLTTYLTCGATGQAVSIAGTSGATPYTTGWESLALPVVAVELIFQSGPQGTSYHTNLTLSNRRGRFSADQFLRPNITVQQLGTGETFAGHATNMDPSAISSTAGGTAGDWQSGAAAATQTPSWNMSDIGALPGQGSGQDPRLAGEQKAFQQQFGALPGSQVASNQHSADEAAERAAFQQQFGALPG